MVEELLVVRGIIVSHETVRQWALKFGQQFANRSVVTSCGLATNGIWMVCHEHVSEGGGVVLYER